MGDIKNLPDRIKRRIRVDEEGCWIWTGYILPTGYGCYRFLLDGKTTWRAHRLVWRLLVGPFEYKVDLHHTCHVRACVNPDHLVSMQPKDHWQHHAAQLIEKAKQSETCKYGHMWTPENTYVRPDSGRRACKRCRADLEIRRRQRMGKIIWARQKARLQAKKASTI